MPLHSWLHLPSITLTNEQNEDECPSSALSPVSSRARNDASFDENITKTSSAAVPDRRRAANDSSALASTYTTSDSRFSPTRFRKSRPYNGHTSSEATAVSEAQPSMAAVARDAREQDTQAQHTIDPLSSHIIKRSSVSPLPAAHPRRGSSSDSATSMHTDEARSTQSHSHQPTGVSSDARHELKKGVKAVSFLSRLMGNVKRKELAEQVLDNGSVTSDAQIEGNEAEVFAAPVDTRSTQLPNYIKVRSRYKERREFEHLFLAQELQCSKRRKLVRTDSSKLLRRKSSATAESDTIWAMQFSRDGMHLAAGGADTIVRVWKVLASTEGRQAHEKQETGAQEHLSAPVFQSQAVREFEGHEAPVLDLSWSKNNFLISSSMDKTVRLWHLSRAECLCTFKHNDFVPSITFHPKDDRFFLAGSLDSKLRLWNISEKSVVYSISVPDMITAVAFMPDGKLAVAGTTNGSCYWYETEGLKYKTQLQIRPDKGQGVFGPKITAIQAAHGRGGDKVLITSNDSKIRLYNVRDKGCDMVFKGNVNDSSQIRGSLSDDGRYVVCGSEDRKAYIWSVTPTETGKLDKKPVEFFDAHDSVTTSVCIAPAKTRRLLAQSEDPIYDLGAVAATNYALARTESQESSRLATENMPHNVQDGDTRSLLNRSNSTIAQSGHKDGNIIITADYAGKIKVFRQDCAWHRRQHEETDRASIFRRADRSSMASSLHTKTSQRSLREAKGLAMSQVASSDRIMSWRQGIAMTPSTNQGSPKIQPQSRESSPPNNPNRASNEDTTAGSASTMPTSTASAERPKTTATVDSVEAANHVFRQEEKEGKSHDSLFLDGKRSYMYWSGLAEASRTHPEGDSLSPGHIAAGRKLHRTISDVSQLSDEQAAAGEESGDEHFDDAMEHHAGVE